MSIEWFAAVADRRSPVSESVGGAEVGKAPVPGWLQRAKTWSRREPYAYRSQAVVRSPSSPARLGVAVLRGEQLLRLKLESKAPLLANGEVLARLDRMVGQRQEGS
jgi:hypothetical protein